MRPFGLPGLAAVAGRLRSGLAEWFSAGDFIISDPVRSDSFTAIVIDSKATVAAFAHDCDRLACASLESLYEFQAGCSSKKSYAWPLVRLYYAAFFAAHAIFRVLGESCTFLDSSQMVSIRRAARPYVKTEVDSLTSGYYHCRLDPAGRSLTCARDRRGSLGAHQTFWKVFHTRMVQLGDGILSRAGVPDVDQEVALKLDDLCVGLSHDGQPPGNWLAWLRNQIHYKQRFGAWFPYAEAPRNPDLILARIRQGPLDALEWGLHQSSQNDLERFVGVSGFLMRLCVEVLFDVGNRCPQGRSFLEFGFKKLFHLHGQRGAAWLCRPQ